MRASLRALLTGIIDYAGLFPPAKLPMEPAIRNCARYRSEPEAWMLGRFICPAARLAELSPFVEELFASGAPLGVSALGRGGDTAEAFRAGLTADLQAIAEFRARHGSRVVVDVLEVKLPADIFRPGYGACAIGGFLCDEADRASAEAAGLRPFFEAGFTGEWRDNLGHVLHFLRGGFKLRCGGLEAAAFPTPEQVAYVIANCAAGRVPFKATAGLHHPLRQPDAPLGVTMHGFLNVFGAGVLAAARGLSEEQVRPIVEDDDATHFAFDDAAFRWRELSASIEQIVHGRELFTSFGSCSFDEPRDDLRALGLL